MHPVYRQERMNSFSIAFSDIAKKNPWHCANGFWAKVAHRAIGTFGVCTLAAVACLCGWLATMGLVVAAPMGEMTTTGVAQRRPLHNTFELTMPGYSTLRIKPQLHKEAEKVVTFLETVKKRYREEGGLQSVMSILPEPEQARWQSIVSSFSRMPVNERLMSINGFFNERQWRKDSAVYGQDEYWATPSEFLQNGGDCEDFAITKYLLLLDLGWPEAALWLVIGETTNKTKNEWHAVVAAKVGNKMVYLDNTASPRALLVTEEMLVKRFAPVLALGGNKLFAFYKLAKP